MLLKFPFNEPHEVQLLTLRAIFTLVFQASNLVCIPLRLEFISRVFDVLTIDTDIHQAAEPLTVLIDKICSPILIEGKINVDSTKQQQGDSASPLIQPSPLIKQTCKYLSQLVQRTYEQQLHHSQINACVRVTELILENMARILEDVEPQPSQPSSTHFLPTHVTFCLATHLLALPPSPQVAFPALFFSFLLNTLIVEGIQRDTIRYFYATLKQRKGSHTAAGHQGDPPAIL